MEAVLDARWDPRDRRAQPAKKHRSLRIYQAAGIIATVAVAVFLAWSALGSFSGVDHLARAPLAEPVGVNVSHPGEMVIYYEGNAKASLNELKFRVRGPDGAPVAFKPYDLDLRYDVDGRVGTAVASFSAPTAGQYLVSSRTAESGARIAVGGDLGMRMMLTDLAGLGASFAAFAAIATIVVHVLRRLGAGRAERQKAVTRAGIPAGRLAASSR